LHPRGPTNGWCGAREKKQARKGGALIGGPPGKLTLQCVTPGKKGARTNGKKGNWHTRVVPQGKKQLSERGHRERNLNGPRTPPEAFNQKFPRKKRTSCSTVNEERPPKGGGGHNLGSIGNPEKGKVPQGEKKAPKTCAALTFWGPVGGGEKTHFWVHGKILLVQVGWQKNGQKRGLLFFFFWVGGGGPQEKKGTFFVFGVGSRPKRKKWLKGGGLWTAGTVVPLLFGENSRQEKSQQNRVTLWGGGGPLEGCEFVAAEWATKTTAGGEKGKMWKNMGTPPRPRKGKRRNRWLLSLTVGKRRNCETN